MTPLHESFLRFIDWARARARRRGVAESARISTRALPLDRGGRSFPRGIDSTEPDGKARMRTSSTATVLVVTLLAALVAACPGPAYATPEVGTISASQARTEAGGELDDLTAENAAGLQSLAGALMAPATLNDPILHGWTWRGFGRRGNVLELRFSPTDGGQSFFVRLSPGNFVTDDGVGSRSFRIGFRTQSGASIPSQDEARVLADVTRRVRANDPGGLGLPDLPGSVEVTAGATLFTGAGWAGTVRIVILVLFLVMVVAAFRLTLASGKGAPVPWGRIAALCGLTALAAFLRFTVSPHAFLHEYYHHGLVVNELLTLPGFQANYGEVGPAFLLQRTGRRDIRLIDLRAVLDDRQSWPEPGPDLLFFQGMFCHFAPFTNEQLPEAMVPRCQAVHERYVLAPQVTALLDGAPSSFLSYTADGRGPWEIGLFAVTGWRDP